MARTRIRLLVAGVATTAALAAPTTASAVTCDGLQEALNEAELHEVVTLDEGQVCSSHYDLPSQSITLQGGGSGATLTGQSKGNFQILSGTDVRDTTISNLTFVDGENFSGGAIRLFGDSPAIIENNTFVGNQADDGDGGAIQMVLDQNNLDKARGDALPIIIRDNDFGSEGENTSINRGGAVFVSAFFRDLVVQDNVFEGNEADSGGGLYVDAARSLTLDGNDFIDNKAESSGGGAFVTNTCSIEVTDNVFESNELASRSMSGGGLHADPGQGCFGGEQGPVRGGQAIEPVVQSGNLFNGNTLVGDANSSGAGGGEAVIGFPVHSTDDRFVDNIIQVGNQATGGGFAQIAFGGEAFVARNLVATGNVADATVTSVPSRSEVPEDESRGGGLFFNGRANEFRIEDSTIVKNQAVTGPGIDGPTFLDTAKPRGAANFNALVLQNSIVFGNVSANSDDITGFTSRDISFSDTCSEGAPATGEGNLCVEPGLVGGSQPGTVNQTANSPTVNKGDGTLVDSDLANDYATDARIIGANVDMGADEFKPAPVVEPEPEPEPGASPQPTPPAAGGVAGVQQKSCKSKRSFRIRLRIPKGKKAISATVRVNGKKVKVVRGKRLRAPVRLRGLPKGKVRVRITIRLANGRKISGVRTYHTCVPKLPGDGPPKV